MLKQLSKILIATTCAISAPTAAFSQVHVEKYTEYCEVFGRSSTCVVVDTRTHDGFLNTRGIYNNQYGYTMKQRFVGAKGFMTWDSYTKKVYKFPYQSLGNQTSRVTPHLTITGVSWD